MSVKSVKLMLSPSLKAKGFKSRNTAWNRSVEDFIDVLDLQESKDRSACTLNVGVCHTGTFKKCWGKGPKPFVDEADCVVRSRIGLLIGERDVWWPEDDPEAPERLHELVSNVALPFLDRMHSLESMRQFLEESGAQNLSYPLPALYLAIIVHELGDEDFCRRLNDLREKSRGAWTARITEVAQRIGCSE